jgi:biotin transport system substrate-specific component
LLGPTGGYLLAFPVAALVTGSLARRGGYGRVILGSLLGMLVIHAGGVAQLAILTGDPAAAFQLGSLPFLPMGLIKAALAAAIVVRVSPKLAKLL